MSQMSVLMCMRSSPRAFSEPLCGAAEEGKGAETHAEDREGNSGGDQAMVACTQGRSHAPKADPKIYPKLTSGGVFVGQNGSRALLMGLPMVSRIRLTSGMVGRAD
mmetsp:Transcript_81696/g.144119  ORF Transcript_81696/g.144119 Transcript_81696/m.144119 type:complete len:106 (+) Transcript_81696:1414-1731(+)